MDDEATREFIIETREGLDQLDRELLALESDPQARERIATVFRAIHTIKGTSAFLGFGRLEKLAHVGESLLALLRDGTLTLSPAIASALLALVDRLRASVAVIETSGTEGPDEHADLIARLIALRSPEAGAEPATLSPAPPPTPVAPVAPVAPPPVAAPIIVPAAPVDVAPPPAPAPVAAPAAPAERADSGTPGAGDNVRIDVRLLDNLMDIVGELVLARNQILQVGSRLEDQAFIAASQRLDLITTELQEQVMKTRMQPIGSVWSKLPRVVRDLAVSCGKQVRVEMIGKETELDRTILESVKDPLTHIVRNAIDHGLEAPQVRGAKGKPRTGTLTLRAFHAGGQVNIEVSDDGGGLDLGAIQRKAVERGLVPADQIARLSEYELAQLVFLPGFSTAKAVTNVSGRGVGMDVVKTNIERIGGTVEIASVAGQGTTIKIRIPLTLAIIPALLVTQDDQRYAIPQANLVELVRIDGPKIKASVEHIQGASVCRLRGQLLPLVDLGAVLQKRPAARRDDDAELNIIVLQAEDRLFGVIIDDVRDTEEIVVKPLGKELKGIPVFAGATIMGDGRVALILDVQDLAQQAGVVRERAERALESKTKTGEAGADPRQTLLLFAVHSGETVAVPLSSVARLEDLARGHIETSAGQCVVQHRGGILPLIDLGGLEESTESLPVIVYTREERSIGVIVKRIVDVVEEVVRVERLGERNGSRGVAVVQGKVTQLLDLEAVIRSHASWFFAEAA